jgi:hypothetical protein
MPAATRATAVAGLIALCLVWLASDVALGRQGCVTGFSPPTLNISAEGTTPGSPATSNVQTSSSTCAWKWEGSQLPDGTPLNGFPTWLNFGSAP